MNLCLKHLDLVFTTDAPFYRLLDRKPSHFRDHEEHGSPPAAKKRRTGSGPDEEHSIQHFTSQEQGPGHKIEQELANALSESVVDTVEPTDQTRGGHDQPEGSPRDQSSSVNPDVASMISEIMDHTERQENIVSMGQQEIPASTEFPGARGYAFLKANSHLKIQSLPILDNLVSYHHPE